MGKGVVAAAIRLGYNTPLLCRTLPLRYDATQHQEPLNVAAKKPVKKTARTVAKSVAKKVVKTAAKAKPAAKSLKKPARPAARKSVKPAAKKPAAKKTVAKKPAARKPVAKKVLAKHQSKTAKKPIAKKVVAKKPAAKPQARHVPVKAKGRVEAHVAVKKSVAKPAAVAAGSVKPHVAHPTPATAPVAGAARKSKNAKQQAVAPVKPAPAPPPPAVRPQGARAKAVVRNNVPEKVIPIVAVQTGVVLPKGYKPTGKESYMNANQMEYFRQRLLSWRADLVEESKQTIENLKEEVRDVGDEAERATRETENSLELRTRDRYRKLIGKIDDALKRIDDGIYGYCVDTGDEIGLERLEARLTAERTIDAQERWEHRQKQMGD
jgi:DnaK suppressor protein